MSDTRLAFEQLTDSARLALGRGDRLAARTTLTAALQSSDAADAVGAASSEELIRLGALYQDAGLNAEAERLFGDAITTAERTLGPDDVGLVPALACLGTALVARGANDEAEPLLTRALSISETELGADHPDLNVLLNALSRLYLKQGAFARAEPLLERLLALKRIKGDDHPEVATVLASLAAVRQGVGNHEGAEQLARRVLKIRERTLAPNHYAIASALELLADACTARGKLSEALLLYQRALSIREQTLGVSHASLRVLRERIADLQLQASDESLGGGDGSATVLSSPSLSFPTLRAPRPTIEPVPQRPSRAASEPVSQPPSRPASEPVSQPPSRPVSAPVTQPPSRPVSEAVSLPPNAAMSLPIALAVAARNDEERAPVPAPAPAVRRADPMPALDEPGETRQQALVMPASTGLLSLQDELRNIENEMNEAQAESFSTRVGAFVSAMWTAVSTRPVQAAVVAGSAVALLLAALVAQPRAAESASDRQTQVGDPLASRSAFSGTSASAIDPSASLTRTASGSVEMRPVSTLPSPRVSAPTRGNEQASEKNTASSETEVPVSLDLGRNGRPALPNIDVKGVDSMARSSEYAAKSGTDPFSKQFWTGSASEKKVSADTSTVAPTRAKIQGALPQPTYPEFLRKSGVEGEVIVQFLVDETGRPDVSTLEVVRSPHVDLTEAVRRVVGRIHFDPALTGGPSPKPRTEVVRISYLFRSTSK